MISLAVAAAGWVGVGSPGDYAASQFLPLPRHDRAAGAATVGAAGVEVLQDVLAETQSTIQPLVPYLDTLRWVLIAIALIGIAVTIYARIDDWKRGQR